MRRAPTLLSPPTRAGFPSVPPASKASLVRLHPRGQLSQGPSDGHRRAGTGRTRPRGTYPELHKEKGIGRSAFKELLEATLLLGELVVDLVDVHGFEVGVTVAGARLANVHK